MSKMRNELLEAKIALEAELVRPIYRAGRNYILAWESGHGNVSPHHRYEHEAAIEKILIRHYARTVMVMQGRRPPKDATLEVACKSLFHLEGLRSQAKRQADLILRSLDRELADAMRGPQIEHDDGTTHYGKSIEVKDETETAPEVEGATAGYWAKIKGAVAKVTAKFKAKLGTIANVNTNGVAERARELEVVAPKDANGRIVKVWNSLMDGRERAWHHDAHEQEQPVTQPFHVGPDLLRFPGDVTLGASLANVCNCRCFLMYVFVDNSTGKRTTLYTSPSAPTRRFARPANPNHPVPNFRGPVEGPPLRPTSVVTLNGRTVAKVVLKDGKTIATMRQVTPTRVEVSVDGRVVARADIRNGTASNVSVDPKFRDQDIDGLLKRSIEHSAARPRARASH